MPDVAPNKSVYPQKIGWQQGGPPRHKINNTHHTGKNIGSNVYVAFFAKGVGNRCTSA